MIQICALTADTRYLYAQVAQPERAAFRIYQFSSWHVFENAQIELLITFAKMNRSLHIIYHSMGPDEGYLVM